MYTLFSFMHIDFLFITNLTRCIFLYNGQIKLSFYWFYLITKLFPVHFLSVYYFSLPQLPVHLPCLPMCISLSFTICLSAPVWWSYISPSLLLFWRACISAHFIKLGSIRCSETLTLCQTKTWSLSFSVIFLFFYTFYHNCYCLKYVCLCVKISCIFEYCSHMHGHLHGSRNHMWPLSLALSWEYMVYLELIQLSWICELM